MAMSKHVTFDYSLAKKFVGDDEIKVMESIVETAKNTLVGKSGAGNDFLGWIDLPVDYDKEEFARIKKAAQKIQSESVPGASVCGRGFAVPRRCPVQHHLPA